MRHGKTLLACITGEAVCLRPTITDDDVKRRLKKACKGNSTPYEGINVLTVNRNLLRELAHHINSPPVIYEIRVNDYPKGLEVKHSDLMKDSLIIVKVEDQTIMMHGMEDGSEPRLPVRGFFRNLLNIFGSLWNGRDLNWGIIKRTKYGWNLGTVTI